MDALVMAVFAIACEHAFGVLFCVYLARRFVSGSRVAYWVVSLAALGLGLLRLHDIVHGNYDGPYLSSRIIEWVSSLCGIAVAALLWTSKDVRIYFDAQRKAGKGAEDVAGLA